MKRLMNLVMLPCKEASLLVDKRSAVGITMWERLRLFIHISVCGGCTRYEDQSKLLDEAIAQLQQDKPTIAEYDSEGLKERIKENLEA